MQYLKSWCTLVLVLLGFGALEAQTKKNIWQHPFVQKWIGSSIDSGTSNNFMVLPAVGFSPETGLEFGLGAIYNFYAHSDRQDLRTSNLTFIGTRTTKGQTSLKLESDLWTTGNTYHIVSELRYRNFPFQYYGIGNLTRYEDQDLLTQQLFRAKVEASRKITSQWYAGLLLRVDRYAYKDEVLDGLFSQIDSTQHRGTHTMIGLSQRFDNRNSNTYTTQGTYAQLRYTYTPQSLSNTSYTGHLIQLDLRHFFKIQQNWTIGLQSLSAFQLKKETPFYLLQEVGGDQMMRGYYLGRYRDQHMIANQLEGRWRFHPRVGLAAFAGIGSTFNSQWNNARWIPSTGGGIRYFYDLEHQGSVRIEFAMGEKRPGEERQKGIYLSLKEAF
jgi:hypothetical protein